MKLIEMLDELKSNNKINDSVYCINVRGLKNSISYGNATQDKLRKRIPESVLSLPIVGAIMHDDSCTITVYDIN